MSEAIHEEPLKLSLKDKVRRATEESAAMCYQCGKCTAGCPVAGEMDYAPNQVLRILQLEIPELEEKILRSLAIWLCVSCETCISRCPKDVDLPLIMDYLRSESVRRGLVNHRAKDILAFHDCFLDSIRKTGRLNEVSLIAGYKLKTGHLLQDVGNAPKLFFSGKLGIIPHKIQNRDAIYRIFDKLSCRKEEGE